MRRLTPWFALLLMSSVALFATPPASAQTSGSPTPAAGEDVILRLVHQTPFNDPDHTDLRLQVRAVNLTDQTFDELSVGITIETPVGSRTEYEDSLQSDTGQVLIANSPPVEGELQGGGRRSLRLPPIDLTALADRNEAAIYPVEVELRSHDLPIATLRSPVIYLTQNPPDHPLDLTWTFVLSAPILTQPDGSFRTPWLQRQVAPGGPLRAEAQALAKLVSRPGPPSVDIAVAPQLLDQLVRMRRGYTLRTDTETTRVPAGRGGSANADDVILDLKTIAEATNVELSPMPFSSPNLPALIGAGLAGDLPEQLTRGQDDVTSVLGDHLAAGILHPPGSRIDQQSLFALHQNGMRLLLLDDETVHQQIEDPQGFADPPVAPLSLGTSSTLNAISPDHGVQAILGSTLPDQDPHLAVQTILGELASIWLEQPSVSRGIAMILSERTGLPGYFYAPFARAIDRAPWLRPMKASAMAAVHPPSTDHPTEIVGRPGPGFSSTYLSHLTEARQAISTYRSIITDDRALPERLEELVLLAESGQFASDEGLGEQFLDAVTTTLRDQLGLVAPDTRQIVTLASRNGVIPVQIVNGSGHSVKVRVELQSARLTFAPGADSQVVEVPSDGVTLTFNVQARTTGRFPVQVVVTTADGSTKLSQRRLVVRSTAYNRIALVITIGAALFLLALWTRRFLPGTKR
jgi:hypothetical protein